MLHCKDYQTHVLAVEGGGVVLRSAGEEPAREHLCQISGRCSDWGHEYLSESSPAFELVHALHTAWISEPYQYDFFFMSLLLATRRTIFPKQQSPMAGCTPHLPGTHILSSNKAKTRSSRAGDKVTGGGAGVGG